MNKRTAKRLDGVSESATLKLNALVQQMKAEGVAVVNLTAGEPDFAAPEAAKQAVIDAVKANQSKYTPVPGLLDLRKLIAEKTNRQQPSVAASGAWGPKNVVVTNGGKQALFNTMLALLDPGEEVLIPSPYWLSYPEMVQIAGGIPKFLRPRFEDGFKLKPQELRAAIGPKVKMLILNSPSNPAGVLYTREEFANLGNVIREAAHPVWVVSDEIYDRITLDGSGFCSFLEAAPFLKNQVVTVNGMSKSAAMTGWRCGWVVAPEDIAGAISMLQGQSTSGISSLTQWAAMAALKLPEEEFSDQIRRYRERRDLVLDILKKCKKIRVFVPQGAFYVFLCVEAALRAGEDAVVFSEELLKDEKVAVVPGTPFGEPGYIRLSFATDEKSLQDGCERLVRFVEKRM